MTEIESFSTAMMTSLAVAMSTLFAAIPKILGFVIILIVGWFLASLIAKSEAEREMNATQGRPPMRSV